MPIICVGELICRTDLKRFVRGRSNRMLDRYGKESFLILKFKQEVPASVMRQILSRGITINENEYQFLGCSSSGLKERSCYMYCGSVEDVDRILAECGSFVSIKSRSKLLKRIALLFSEGRPLDIEIPDQNVCEVNDIETVGGNFTDGCGSISVDLAERIRPSCEGVQPHYTPSVYQIRYQGCKGVVVVDRTVEQGCLLVRPSMKKFNPGTKPLRKLWLCDYSKPYTFGHLNRQFITLLSSLGVRDEVFLRIQENHFKLLRNMMRDPHAAFQLLQFDNQSELAFRCMDMEAFKKKDVQLQLSLLRAKLTDKLDKLRLIVPKSRNVFGVCDPTGQLNYGECFVRYTEGGHPKTLLGNVVVAKNPCYLLGDVRVLKCVPLEGLEGVVDCIVFPTRGKRPHSAEIAGSDLDGDQYFVCWDEDLLVLRVHEPYDYPSVDAPEITSVLTRAMLIDYFVSYHSSMGLIDTYYKHWASRKGASCSECQDLGKLFSRSVDASKTGDRVVIPGRLKPPREDESAGNCTGLPVWEEMSRRAQSFTCEEVVDPEVSDDEFVWNLVQEKYPNMSEYQLFCFLQHWCSITSSDEGRSRDSLLNFAKYIEFGEFTTDQQVEAIDAGIPQEFITNALNKSQLLPQNLRSKFLLSDPHRTWRFYFRSKSSDFKWDHFLKAIQSHPESMLIVRLPDGDTLEVTFVLHFLAPPAVGETSINGGSAVAYFSSPRFGLGEQHSLGSGFKLNLTDHTLQLYQGDVRHTFIWFAQSLKVDTTDLQISVDLTRFRSNILTKDRHPRVRKESVVSIEVFVRSYSEEPAYLDVVELGTVDVEEVEAADELEDFPSDPEDGQIEEDDSLSAEDSLRAEKDNYLLLQCAKKGDPCHFQLILDEILSKEELCGSEVFAAFIALLKSLVTKSCHRSLKDGALESLQKIITSLSSQLKSPMDCLDILSKVCQFHSPPLSEHTLTVILSNIRCTDVNEYLTVASNWKSWYFIPWRVASQLSQCLYSLYSSLCTPQTEVRADGDTMGLYACHFTGLLLTSLLNEISSVECSNCDKIEDSSTKLIKLKAYDLQTCFHEEKEDGKKTHLIGFRRSLKGVSSRNFTQGNYIAAGIMKMDSSGDNYVTIPVVVGRISKASYHPADIMVEFEKPLPTCLNQSIQLGRGHWQLNLIANITGFNRSLEALRHLIDNPASTSLFPALVLSHTCNPSASPITSLLVSQEDCDVPVDTSDSLNPRQLKAVQTALQQAITLIHGPPGTGKTHVACEIVKCQLARNSSNPVLVAAETNLAVDNLCEKLLALGVRVVRIGRLDQVSPSIRAISLEGQVEQKRIEEGREKSYSVFPSKRMVKDILRAAEVVATTATGAGDPVLKGMEFPFVIVDEATQVTEPTSLIPLVHGCQQLCLIGDPQQLSPTVLTSRRSDSLEKESLSALSVTLFHRLQKLLPSVFLNLQYRMHQHLAEFPSQKFYEGRLKTAPSCTTGEHSKEIKLLKAHGPLVFVNTCVSGHCGERHFGTSYQNQFEASVSVNAIRSLTEHKVTAREVTVLTPYAGQVKCIQEKLQHEKLSHVKVCTIDAFQGRETDFLVFSTVRCNTRGELGFADDKYRMNVLLTRAKHGLVGIGCADTLSKHSDLWKDWLHSGQVKVIAVLEQDSGLDSTRKKQRERRYPESYSNRGRRREETVSDRSPTQYSDQKTHGKSDRGSSSHVKPYRGRARRQGDSEGARSVHGRVEERRGERVRAEYRRAQDRGEGGI